MVSVTTKRLAHKNLLGHKISTPLHKYTAILDFNNIIKTIILALESHKSDILDST